MLKHIARILSTACCMFVAGTTALAQCQAPKFRTEQEFDGAKAGVTVSVSISLGDFTPPRLVCLAERFRQTYTQRVPLYVLIFSSSEAAKYYRPWAPHTDQSPVNDRIPGRRYAKDLHAVYQYDPGKGEEFIEVKPIGSDLPLQTDTRLVLPSERVPPCATQIANRCLLSADEIQYPLEAYQHRVSGSAIVSGLVSRNGTVTSIRSVSSDSESPGFEVVFARAALSILKTWRFRNDARQNPMKMVFEFVIDAALPPDATSVEFLGSDRIKVSAHPTER